MNRSSVMTAAFAGISGVLMAQSAPQPPVGPRKDHVQAWHGEKVNDPWFWLREKDSAPVFEYLRGENAYAEAILVTTSYNDSQVMYWEPAKYVAKLRTLKSDGNPLLLKCKMDPAGHGGASGRYDALKDKAFEMAWMLKQVGITK